MCVCVHIQFLPHRELSLSYNKQSVIAVYCKNYYTQYVTSRNSSWRNSSFYLLLCWTETEAPAQCYILCSHMNTESRTKLLFAVDVVGTYTYQSAVWIIRVSVAWIIVLIAVLVRSGNTAVANVSVKYVSVGIKCQQAVRSSTHDPRSQCGVVPVDSVPGSFILFPSILGLCAVMNWWFLGCVSCGNHVYHLL